MVEGRAINELIVNAARVPVENRVPQVNLAFERILGFPDYTDIGRTSIEI